MQHRKHARTTTVHNAEPVDRELSSGKLRNDASEPIWPTKRFRINEIH